MSGNNPNQQEPPPDPDSDFTPITPAVPDHIMEAVDALLEQANIEMGRIPDTRQK